MNPKAKRISFFVVLIGVTAVFWAIVKSGHNSPKTTYSQFLQQVQSGQVDNAVVVIAHSGVNRVNYSLKDGSRAATVVPSDYRDVLQTMQQKMVDIEIRDASSAWLRVLANATPFFVLLGFWVFMMRRLPGRAAK